MKLLQEIGAEILMEIKRIQKVLQNIHWLTLRKRLVDLILDIVISVENMNFMIIEKFGKTVDAVRQGYYQKEGSNNMKEQVILKVDRDEFDLIKKWGTNFVLMTKSGFIHSRKLTMQKSQQLLDGLDKQPNDEIEVLEKIHEEKKQLDRERKNKDNPYGQIGETYGGD
tara:strand:- start:548 stop:1051 length:504 start_codon:yes stop_codon:yes gene_type:complete